MAYPTLLEVTRSYGEDGKIISEIAEILTETNEMLLDIPMMEGNLVTGNRTSVRTGLPTPTWRQFYGGVQPTKGTTAIITDETAMMEAYAEVDKSLADLASNTQQFLLQENYAHIEGMSQTAQQAFLYGNHALNPTQFNGLSPRFNDLSANNAENIIDALGSGTDNASIWLICWGPNSAFGIFPKGSRAGINMDFKGQVTIEDVDGAGGRMEAYRTHYKWDLGLCVKDWRYVVRIANIDRSNLTPDASGSSANLPELMFQALDLLPNMNGNCAFYMDRTVRTTMRQQIANGVSNSTLTVENVGGVRVNMFDGIPVRKVDRLSGDEARVV